MSVTLTINADTHAELAEQVHLYSGFFARKVGANPALAAPYEAEPTVITSKKTTAKTNSKKTTTAKTASKKAPAAEAASDDGPTKEDVVKSVQGLIKAKDMKAARKVILAFEDSDGDTASTVASIQEKDYAAFIEACEEAEAA